MDTVSEWFARGRDWLDERGKRGVDRSPWYWAFIFFWPVGLAILFYIIWSKRMSCRGWKRERREAHIGKTGNAAFDGYREGDPEAARGRA